MRLEARAAVVAWTIWAVSLLLGVAAIAIALGYTGTEVTGWEDVLIATVFPTMGALIITKRGSHTVGWLFILAGATSQLNVFASAYAVAVFARGAGFPFGTIAAWLGAWTWTPSLAVLTLFIPQLFPSGRFLSPRWRVVGWLTGGLVVAGVAVVALLPFSVTQQELPGTRNPLAVAPLADHLALLAWFFGLGSVCALVSSVASLIVRFRRARGEERQQMKWFVYSMCLFAIALMATTLIQGIDWITMIGIMAYVGALSIALLRYRLYEIDRIINRTVVYLVITGGLAGAYFAIVLLLQLLLPIDSRSPLIVAVSTLAVAAAFRPVRSRVQTVVDRRFNRARYDASRTLERFAGRLRSEVDLDSLGGGLVQTVADTMQPTAVSLWLRGQSG